MPKSAADCHSNLGQWKHASARGVWICRSSRTLWDFRLGILCVFMSLCSTTCASVFTNNVQTRYFITEYTNQEFPMAVSFCSPVDSFSGSFQMAECIDESTLKWTKYTDANCTITSITEETYFNASSQTGTGTLYDFNCDTDRLDSYAVLDMGAPSCDALSLFYAAVGVCSLNTVLGFFDPEDYTSNYVYCDPKNDLGQVQTFITNGGSAAVCDNLDDFDSAWNVTDTCNYLFTPVFPDAPVYGRIVDCVLNASVSGDVPSVAPSGPPTASSLLTNDVDTRYFIGQYNAAEFPMAVSVCNPFDNYFLNTWQKAECIDEVTAQWSTYSDPNCSVLVSSQKVNSTFQTGVGTYFDFNCDPNAVDAYATIAMATGNCDATEIVYAAVGVCAFNTEIETIEPPGYKSNYIYCEDGLAQVQTFEASFLSGSDCSESRFQSAWNATSTCGLLYESPFIDDFVVGQLVECVLDGSLSLSGSDAPSAIPSVAPSVAPSVSPTAAPTCAPSAAPSATPTTSSISLLSNNVDTRYFIGQYNAAEFPMAVSVCNPFDNFNPRTWQKAECIDEVTAQWSTYADANCSALASSQIINSTFQTGVGTYFDFNCDPNAVDAYATIAMATGNCDATEIVYAAVGVCSLDTELESIEPDGYKSNYIYCEDGLAQVQTFEASFLSGSDCDEQRFESAYNVTTTCDALYFSPFIDTYVVGQIVDCVLDGSLSENDAPTPAPFTPTAVPSEMPTTTPTSSSAPQSKDLDTRYFVGVFRFNLYNDPFPIALSLCSPISFEATIHQMAVCIDESTVYYTRHSDANCTNSSTTSLTVIDAATYQTGEGSLYDFNCDSDRVDNYAVIEISDDSCDASSFKFLYAAVGVCTTDGNDESKYVWCSDESENFAQVQTYSSSDANCSDAYFDSAWNATDTCDVLYSDSRPFAYDIDIGWDDFSVYGRVAECVVFTNAPTASPTTLSWWDDIESIETRYFIGSYNGFEFPLAVSVCNPTDLFGTYFQRAVCIDEDTIEHSIYSDENCTTVLAANTYSSEVYQNGWGTYLDFNCDSDRVDSYSLVEQGAYSCEGDMFKLYSALGVCTLNTELGNKEAGNYETNAMWCDKNSTYLYIFWSPSATQADCTEDNFAFNWFGTDSCGFLLDNNDIDIYGRLIECELYGDLSSPTATPTATPTAAPTDAKSLDTPTEAPIQLETTSTEEAALEMVSSDAVSVSLQSLSNSGNSEFNSGIRQEFAAVIAITLSTPEQQALFRSALIDGNETINVTTSWRIYETSSGTSVLSSFASSDYLLYSDALWLDSSQTKASMTSYLVLYPSTVISEYSSSVCTDVTANQEKNYFDFGAQYTFALNVSVIWTSSDAHPTATQSHSLALTVNTPPSGGSCSVTPQQGVVLTDVFDFSCSDWSDPDAPEAVLLYNFLWQDDGLFLKAQYDTDPTASTILSNGNHTISAVIMDNLTYLTCYDINVVVAPSAQMNDTSINNFTSWLTQTYNDLIESYEDELNASSQSAADENHYLSEVILLTEITYTVGESYIATQNYTDSNDDIVDSGLTTLQGDLIDNLMDAVEAVFNETDADVSLANNVLSVLASVTDTYVNEVIVPVVDINDQNLDELYKDSTVTRLLETVDTLILPQFEEDKSQFGTDAFENVFDTLDRVLTLRRLSNESSEGAQQNGDNLVSIANEAVYLLLSDKVPGESYYHKSDTYLTTQVTKISKTNYDNNICGNLVANVQLSNEYVLSRTKNIDPDGADYYLDCIVMSVEAIANDIYANLNQTLDNIDNATFQSNMLYIDVARENNRYAAASAVEITEECDPIIFTLNITNSSYFDEVQLMQDGQFYTYPDCIFYNESSSQYSDYGCFVLSSTQDEITCACVHLTFFSASWEEFTPEVAWTGEDIYLSVTWSNFWDHPLGFILVLCWIFVGVVIIYLGKLLDLDEKFDDLPLVAQKESVFVHNEDVDRSEYRDIQEALVFRSDDLKHKNCLIKAYHIFKIKLRNDHIWWGLCCRHHGTAYSHERRTAVLIAKFLTSMAVNAVFFGTSKKTQVGELFLSMFESLCSFVPMFMIEHLIKHYRPDPRPIRSKNILDNIAIMSMLNKFAEEDDFDTDAIATTGDTPKLGQQASMGTKTKSQAAKYAAVTKTKTKILLDALEKDHREESESDSSKANRLQLELQLAQTQLEDAGSRRALPDTAGTTDHDGADGAVTRSAQGEKGQGGESYDPVAIRYDTDESDGNAGEDDNHDDMPPSKVTSAARKPLSGTRALTVDRLHVVYELRDRLFQKRFLYPTWVRHVSVTIIVVWILACAIITSIFCVFFDVKYDTTNSYQSNIDSSECSDSYYDIAQSVWINYNLTTSDIDKFMSYYDEYGYTPYDPPASQSWGAADEMSMSARFLLTCFVSYMWSVFLWAPLISLAKTFRDLIRFTLNPNRMNDTFMFYDEKYLVHEDHFEEHPALAGVKSESVMSTSSADGKPTGGKSTGGKSIELVDTTNYKRGKQGGDQDGDQDGGQDGIAINE